ncbi:MAG: tRNA pseudouridine(55) synthase TruB [Myxococcales bacterium]|nr:tRNA pseudouridine(55) synthase TruB [Myxococcales bacterium]
MTRRPALFHGVLGVDKPAGVTSHDVVAAARRVFATREVGHAGTLDPMATGVLVLLVGEATKLSSWLTADDKVYRTTLQLGRATDSLDADGAVTAEAPFDPARLDPHALRALLDTMTGPLAQVPPAVSAIKVDGEAMHVRVRRGEVVALPPRDVELHEVHLDAVDPARGAVSLTMRVSKGFYVRAFARDLAERLGTLGHLTALRRIASGRLSVEGCVPGQALFDARADAGLVPGLRGALRGFAALGELVRVVTVEEAAALALHRGQRPVSAAPEGTALVLREGGSPVCVAASEGGVWRVLRGLGVPVSEP